MFCLLVPGIFLIGGTARPLSSCFFHSNRDFCHVAKKKTELVKSKVTRRFERSSRLPEFDCMPFARCASRIQVAHQVAQHDTLAFALCIFSWCATGVRNICVMNFYANQASCTLRASSSAVPPSTMRTCLSSSTIVFTSPNSGMSFRQSSGSTPHGPGHCM